MAAEQGEARGDEAGEALLSLIRSVVRDLEAAVSLAQRIGPEWENVVDDIRAPFAEQLEALADRLESRSGDRSGRRSS